MKSFSIISLISLVATLSSAVPVANPQITQVPTPTNTTTGAPSPTATTTLVFTPSPLSSYQYPVILPNGVECIAPYLVLTMSSEKPDKVFPKIAQIGPNAFVAMAFNLTHAGKECRFHFAFSNLADGGNRIGTEDIYALKSGAVDENTTYNTQPILEAEPVARFKVTGAKVIPGEPGPHEMYPFVTRFDFPCPTTNTGWAIRGSNGTLSNWSWNHGLIVEVLGDNPWVDGNVY